MLIIEVMRHKGFQEMIWYNLLVDSVDKSDCIALHVTVYCRIYPKLKKAEFVSHIMCCDLCNTVLNI